VRGIASSSRDRGHQLLTSGWLDVAWAVFAVANLVAMALVPQWETVPFHFIWVSLTLVYGYRVWGAFETTLALTAVVVATGALLVYDVLRQAELADELTEVPLMGAMFLAMVWHAQRRRGAMEDLRRVSDANLRLLQRERQFVQDASHELRTPITVALGHAELVERDSPGPEVAEDARIVVDELLRLRRLADRLLLLATSEDPDFLSRSPVDIGRLLAAALQRWAPIDRHWRLEPAEPAVVVGDPDRLATIFERFARLDDGRSRDRGGLGLGLAIVKAIVQAHGGTVQVKSAVGAGSAFEILLPLEPSPDPTGAHRGAVAGQRLQGNWLHG
jgi:signal transduction histidine kinase